ncbi:hypothetical protein [Prosthecobacter dejongeii]|uniref:hypothetical protein n=1 Tax=Prosthecobacter dejongeii TaxID=48465 RepID=UPI00160ACFDB|nr:hypothetical protein [Prosthecobacter dejongeii]
MLVFDSWVVVQQIRGGPLITFFGMNKGAEIQSAGFLESVGDLEFQQIRGGPLITFWV